MTHRKREKEKARMPEEREREVMSERKSDILRRKRKE